MKTAKSTTALSITGVLKPSALIDAHLRRINPLNDASYNSVVESTSARKRQNMRSYCGVYTRFSTKADWREMARIERAVFEFAWKLIDFKSALEDKSHVGMVAEHEGRIVGYVIWKCCNRYFQLVNIAVDPECRQSGIGTQLLNCMTTRLGIKSERISAEVRESNLTAQKFLQANGFRATKVCKGLYDETPEDAYFFEFRLDWSADGYEVLNSIMQGDGKVIPNDKVGI